MTRSRKPSRTRSQILGYFSWRISCITNSICLHLLALILKRYFIIFLFTKYISLCGLILYVKLIFFIHGANYRFVFDFKLESITLNDNSFDLKYFLLFWIFLLTLFLLLCIITCIDFCIFWIIYFNIIRIFISIFICINSYRVVICM